MILKGAVQCTASMASHCLELILWIIPSHVNPALLMRISMHPNFWIVASMRRLGKSSAVTSPTTTIASPPDSRIAVAVCNLGIIRLLISSNETSTLFFKPLLGHKIFTFTSAWGLTISGLLGCMHETIHHLTLHLSQLELWGRSTGMTHILFLLITVTRNSYKEHMMQSELSFCRLWRSAYALQQSQKIAAGGSYRENLYLSI